MLDDVLDCKYELQSNPINKLRIFIEKKVNAIIQQNSHIHFIRNEILIGRYYLNLLHLFVLDIWCIK